MQSAQVAELEIHIPISPTETFFTMVHYFAASLRLNGGKYADSRIVVTVGANQEAEDLHDRLPWSRRYPIEWKWLDRDLFRAHSYHATALERFRLPFQARAVMLLDADTLIVAPFDDLVDGVLGTPAFVGAVAHISPFLQNPELSAEAWWARIFSAAGLPTPDLVCEHTGWNVMYNVPQAQYCPPYFNLGMLIAPRRLMTRVGNAIHAEIEVVNRVIENGFRCQIAVPLALRRTRTPWRAASMRYNFPNDLQLESHYRADVADLRILHYLRIGPFDKARDFRSVWHVRDVLHRDDFSGINSVFQAHLTRVHQQVVRDLY